MTEVKHKYLGYPQVRIPPIALQILLHTYYSPQKSPFADTQVYDDWIRWFLANDLIKKDYDGSYSTTSRGDAMVNMLCNSPLPEKELIWVDPRTKEEIPHNDLRRGVGP